MPAVALFTAGALAVLALPSLPSLPWLAGLCLPALLPWRWRRYYALVLLGILLSAWRAQGSLDSRWPLADSDHEVAVEGRIASLPEKRLSAGMKEESVEEGEGESEERTLKHDWRFLFSPIDHSALPPLIRVSWYRSEQILRGGD